MFNFFKKSTFGLDISDYSIEMVSLGGSIEKPKLLAMGREILEPGIVEDGKILQKEKLEAILRGLVKRPKFGQLKSNRLIFALPESKTFIHFFELPDNLKKEKIREEAEFQAIHNFPLPLKDLYFDFKIRNKEVLLVAAPKDIVKDYLELFKKIRLQPLALETESLSLARSLIKNQKETILIVDIGARTTNFSIFDAGRLRLSITTDVAGNKFTQALNQKLTVSLPEAENLKKEIGLNPEKKEGKVFLVLQKEIQKVISEIQKIDKYFYEKENKSFEKIILAGGSATLPNLTEYLADNLEKPVIAGDPWMKVDIEILKEKEYLSKALKINPILYATVVGSALRGLMRNAATAEINLLPKK